MKFSYFSGHLSMYSFNYFTLFLEANPSPSPSSPKLVAPMVRRLNTSQNICGETYRYPFYDKLLFSTVRHVMCILYTFKGPLSQHQLSGTIKITKINSLLFFFFAFVIFYISILCKTLSNPYIFKIVD